MTPTPVFVGLDVAKATLAYGRYTVSAYTAGGSVWVTPGAAEGVWSGFAPTVSSSG